MNADISVSMPEEREKDWSDYAQGVAWGTVVLYLLVGASYIMLIGSVHLFEINLFLASFIATIIMYIGFTVLHEAGHGNIAHGVSWMKPIENFMGWSVSIPFLIMPFGAFAKLHDYHHAFTNDPDRDPDHWISGNSWAEASIRAFTVVMNYGFLTLTRFRKDPIIAKTHKSTFIYYIGSIIITLSLIANGFIIELIMVGIIPALLASYILGMFFDWIPHMPTRQQSRYQNTRSYLFPGIQLISLGQSYHHIHHLYPRVPWYNYGRVFRLILPELKANNAPIESLFANTLGSEYDCFGRSPNATEPSSVDGFHKLTLEVEDVRKETANAVAITFKSLNGKTIPFKAGQYVTVTKYLNNESITRCYSVCESPNSNKLTIGVKQVEGGTLSTYLNTELKIGHELTVAGPFGEFIYDTDKIAQNKSLTLIASGSGITPLLSIIKTALESNEDSEIHLIYANKSVGNIMFLQELNALQAKYPQRFMITSSYRNNHAGWIGINGYIDEKKLAAIIAEYKNMHNREYFICANEKITKIAVDTLTALNIDDKAISLEKFIQAPPKAEGILHKVNVELSNGVVHEFDVGENQTILQAATSLSIKLPSACGVGQCGCCMLKVSEGTSELTSNNLPGLLKNEQENAFTLACQCRPKSSMSLIEKGKLY
jgi:ferredoxin-NADP reductase/fatty acid desaturase